MEGGKGKMFTLERLSRFFQKKEMRQEGSTLRRKLINRILFCFFFFLFHLKMVYTLCVHRLRGRSYREAEGKSQRRRSRGQSKNLEEGGGVG